MGFRRGNYRGMRCRYVNAQRSEWVLSQGMLSIQRLNVTGFNLRSEGNENGVTIT